MLLQKHTKRAIYNTHDVSLRMVCQGALEVADGVSIEDCDPAVIQYVMKYLRLIYEQCGYLKDEHVISDKGETEFSYEEGIFTLNSPAVKVLAGCVRSTKSLGDVEFFMNNDNIAIAVYALDCKSISSSDHIIISTIGMCENSFEKYSKNNMPNHGYCPVMYDDIRSSIIIANNSSHIKAYALKSNGFRELQIPVHYLADKFSITLVKNMHYEILKDYYW